MRHERPDSETEFTRAGNALRPFNCANGFDIASGKARCGLTADRNDVPAERQAAPPRNRAA